ncbi:MAG: FAD-dependent oxidoreductase [Bacteroidia bacterium]|nr:FAD-dependent oxidoreductase [Bacteroidia bacterium]
MKRRSFLKKGLGIAATTASFGGSQSLLQLNTLSPKNNSDIIVIGAGVFGVWTAFYLQELGAKVRLIDAYGPGNSRASSGGESRILRSDYGDRWMYSKMNIRAFELWDAWQEEWGASFMYPTGRLKLGLGENKDKLLKDQEGLKKLGVSSELLDNKELSYRWPQMNLEGIASGMYFPGGKGGSTLMAREAIRIVAEEFVKKGGKLEIGKVETGKSIGGKQDHILLNQKEKLSADTYIFACGPWTPRLFPNLFEDKIKVVRRDVLFVGAASGDDRYSYPNFPVWSFSNQADARYYGMPDIRGRGLKVAPWPDNNGIDLDKDDRLVNMYELKRVREFIAKRFPGLKDQPVLETRVCQLSFSSDEHFIIDQHPEMENIWFTCAGSGHAFKHGPALGEYISNRIYEGKKLPEYDDAFRLH